MKKRIKLIIYPKLQYTLIAVNSLIMFIIIGAVAFQSHQHLNKMRELGIANKMPSKHPYFGFLNLLEADLNKYLLIGAAIGVLISAIITLLLSHKMAGPIVRLRGYFKDISETYPQKDFQELQFRKNDFFADLPPHINQAVEKIKKHNA